MAALTTMGRPKIEGLAGVNLRLPAADLAALDRVVAVERERRHNPALTRTDLMREVLGAYAREHDPQRKTRRGGSTL